MTRDFRQLRLAQTAVWAKKAFADHQLISKFESEHIRHWRCAQPGSWAHGFDVLIWPGKLLITGDIGELLLQREYDMLAWAQQAIHDPYYVAGKVPHAIPTREFDDQAAKAAVLDWYRQHGRYIRDSTLSEPEMRSVTRDAMRELWDNASWEDEAQFYSACSELPDMDVHDLGDCQNYNYNFLWCYQALRWFLTALATQSVTAVDPAPLVAAEA